MSVLVTIGGRKAFFRAGVWRASDRALERQLNHATEMWIQATGGPPINHPDPENATAREVCRILGGEFKLHVPADPYVTRRHFLKRRQLRLDF